MNRTLWLINGPPRAGKDTTAAILTTLLSEGVFQAKMSAVLKEGCHRALGLFQHGGIYGEEDVCDPLPHDYFEDRKDEPMAAFCGSTPRQAYINFSEGFLKPTGGDDILGRLMVSHLIECSGTYHRHVVISDSGFNCEAPPLVEKFGADNVRVLRVHREGHTFEGDSREWLDLTHLGVSEKNHRDLHNCGTGAYREAVRQTWLR